MLTEYITELRKRTTADALAVLKEVRESDIESRIQTFVSDIVEKSIRPVLEARVAELDPGEEVGEVSSRVAFTTLSELLARLDDYPLAWKVVVDEALYTMRVEIPDREMDMMAARIDRGTTVVPKIPHVKRIERFFAEQISRVIARIGLNKQLTVVK